MTLQHASDLSPAQRLLEEITQLHQHPESGSPAGCQSDLLDYQIKAIQDLFTDALLWCEDHTEAHSWQRRRLYALLGPMYLEIAPMIERKSQHGQYHELLDIYSSWKVRSSSNCKPYQDALTQASSELQDLLAEMIIELD